MGQEQSATRHSASSSRHSFNVAHPTNVIHARQTSINISLREVTDELYDAAEPEIDLDGGNTVIPGIIHVVSGKPTSNHVLLERLNSLPRFEPFLKMPNQQFPILFRSDTAWHKEYVCDLAEPLGIILARFEEHFRRCSREICNQQTKLTQMVQTADDLSLQAVTVSTDNQQKCKQAIGKIASVLPTVVQIVNKTHRLVHDIFHTLRELDELLPSEDRICGNDKYPKVQEVFKQGVHRKRNTLRLSLKEARDQPVTSTVVTRETARVDTYRASSGVASHESLAAGLYPSSGIAMNAGPSKAVTGGAAEFLRHIAAHQNTPVLATPDDVRAKLTWGRYSPSVTASSIGTSAQSSDACLSDSPNTQNFPQTPNKSRVYLERPKSVMFSNSNERDPHTPYSLPHDSDKVHYPPTMNGVETKDVRRNSDLNVSTHKLPRLHHRKSEPWLKPEDKTTSKDSTMGNSSFLHSMLQLQLHNTRDQEYRKEKKSKESLSISSSKSALNSTTPNSTRTSPKQQSMTELNSDSVENEYIE